MLTVRRVEPDDADAHALWKAQERDLAERYDEPDLELETVFPTLVGSWVGYAEDGSPVASIVARWSPYEETRPGDVEIKRLWVEPAHRGHGHARVMLGTAEQAARRAGATRLILETGTGQPEAMALYESSGWLPLAPYGEYHQEPDSRCYQRHLPTRVLVVNGTMGAGKTTIAAAVHDLLAERGAHSGYVDADFLCQAEPHADSDPFNQRLLFANLAAIAPNYRAAGFGFMVVPRVVEDARDRDRYAHAFADPDAGAAEVAIVRVDAPEAVRLDRLTAREPEGYWRDHSHARTVELDAILRELDGDDAVVDNAGDRDRLTVAAEVLEAAGW
ncbi:GNAT family N-acetyltransferase [Demequina sp. NBRC 110056]|uniref:GNAT family N-acetyltransferase n=1 Tax=Demequina sp. NBRC 110056 TaxID=1570345 RepID=UPI000A0181FA|nr:GNAT family N-acetyltransferase [Demequina sp. NBRC 110056]